MLGEALQHAIVVALNVQQDRMQSFPMDKSRVDFRLDEPLGIFFFCGKVYPSPFAIDHLHALKNSVLHKRTAKIALVENGT